MLHIPDNLDRRQATAAKKFTAKACYIIDEE